MRQGLAAEYPFTLVEFDMAIYDKQPSLRLMRSLCYITVDIICISFFHLFSRLHFPLEPDSSH